MGVIDFFKGIFSAGPELKIANKLDEDLYVFTGHVLEKYLGFADVVSQVLSGNAMDFAGSLSDIGNHKIADLLLEQARQGKTSLAQGIGKLEKSGRSTLFCKLGVELVGRLTATERQAVAPLVKEVAATVPRGASKVVLTSAILENITSLKQAAINVNPEAPLIGVVVVTGSLSRAVAFPSGARAEWTVGPSGATTSGRSRQAFDWGADGRIKLP